MEKVRQTRAFNDNDGIGDCVFVVNGVETLARKLSVQTSYKTHTHTQRPIIRH